MPATLTNPTDPNSQPRSVDHVDFIDGEAHKITAILGLMAVASRAIAACNECDDGIGSEEKSTALKGLAEVAESVSQRVNVMQESATAIFELGTKGGAR